MSIALFELCNVTRRKEICLYFKNKRESWIKRTKLFRIMDFNQTISLLIPIFTLCLFIFFEGDGYCYSGPLNTFLPSDTNIETFLMNIIVQIFFCMIMYVWKLMRYFSVNTHADVVDVRLKSINKELLFIKEFPSLFIHTKKNGKVVVPTSK